MRTRKPIYFHIHIYIYGLNREQQNSTSTQNTQMRMETLLNGPPIKLSSFINVFLRVHCVGAFNYLSSHQITCYAWCLCASNVRVDGIRPLMYMDVKI